MPDNNSSLLHAGETLLLSVVVPVFNEEDNIVPLLTEIELGLDSLTHSYEVIFVDDASTDSTPKVLQEVLRTSPRVRTLRHLVNCGQSAAQASGFRIAKGSLIMTLDGDRQNNPLDAHLLWAALKPDMACVCGVRRKRNDTRLKQFSSWAANSFRRFITRDSFADVGCNFRLMRKDALEEMLIFNGMHRFIPIILRLQGHAVTEVMIDDRPRVAGTSKYGVGNRLWRGIRDCLAMRWYAARAIPFNRTGPLENRPGRHPRESS